MTRLLVLTSLVLSLTACSTSTDEPSRVDDPASTGDAGGTGNKGGPAVATGLPCDVAAVLSQHCATCHGNPTAFGAPFSLVTHDDLAALKDGKRRLELALARVHDDARPMPPAPNARLSSAEMATLQAYLDAGLPKSDASCSTATLTPGATIAKPSDCENTYELKANGGAGPGDQTKFQTSATPALEGNQYQCFYFDPPYGDDAAMYWFDSILDNVGSLHHWILYGTDNKTHPSGTTAGCNASQAGSYFIAGWAPGGSNGAAAGDVALQLPHGPNAGMILEVHYYNNTGVPQQDASGIRFCTGKQAGRPHLAAVHTLGSEGICIAPGGKQDVVAQCKPRGDMGDVHITGIWPHMHKTARHMKVTVRRANGATDVIHDAPFDFNAQIFYPMKDDVVLHTGDTVETLCSYQNEGTSEVHYGERTQDEMCYAFTAAWPAGGLAAAPSLFSNPTNLGNRCADSLSILKSCNGLDDQPVNVNHP